MLFVSETRDDITEELNTEWRKEMELENESGKGSALIALMDLNQSLGYNNMSCMHRLVIYDGSRELHSPIAHRSARRSVLFLSWALHRRSVLFLSRALHSSIAHRSTRRSVLFLSRAVHSPAAHASRKKINPSFCSHVLHYQAVYIGASIWGVDLFFMWAFFISFSYGCIWVNLFFIWVLLSRCSEFFFVWAHMCWGFLLKKGRCRITYPSFSIKQNQLLIDDND